MERIHFRTTHNLVLSYPKASLLQRILAFIIDSIFVYLGIIIIIWIFGRSELLLSVFVTMVLFFYHLTFEIFWNGQSPGKRILKLRVLSIDGNTPSIKSYLLRWCFRFIDIGLSMGSLAMLSIYSSDKSQRIGDLLGGTTVVQTKLNTNSTLNSITNLNEVKKELKYSNLTQYSDSEMLMVKKMLSRYKSHPTETNSDLLSKLASKFANDLGLREPNYYNQVTFLQDILEEYILVTR